LPTTDASGFDSSITSIQSARLEFDVFAPDLIWERISFGLGVSDGSGTLLWGKYFWLTPCDPTTTFSFDLADYGFLDQLSDGNLQVWAYANWAPLYNDFAITRGSLNVGAHTPEPMSMALFGIGLLGTGYLRKRKNI